MLNTNKRQRLLTSLKTYQKKYFSKKLDDLDESGTRLLVNELLSEVLCYQTIEEIKTEYMIRGTYADYMVQTKGDRHFLVEVKSLSLNLSEKHLRQTVNYGANEGIDYALLTNGKDIHFYRILFNKPIESKLIFKIDLSDPTKAKENAEWLQHLHRDEVIKNSLDLLWNKFVALETFTIAGLLYNSIVLNFLRRELKRKFKSKFEEREIKEALTNMICTSVQWDKVKVSGSKKTKQKDDNMIVTQVSNAIVENVISPDSLIQIAKA
jgi:hypothetical protein